MRESIVQAHLELGIFLTNDAFIQECQNFPSTNILKQKHMHPRSQFNIRSIAGPGYEYFGFKMSKAQQYSAQLICNPIQQGGNL